MDTCLHVAVELDGAGRHPAAWRRADSRAEHLFSPAHWAALARTADAAGAALLLLTDEFSAHSAGAGLVRGRLEAPALAARLALETAAVGLVPLATVTHTEPFHVAKAIASLDHASSGRAGWEVSVSRTPAGTGLVGRAPVQDEASLWAEATEAVEVARLLWDSWEDDAEIRDVATGRFVDRDKLHYVDFVGAHFSVKGPSITPRSPRAGRWWSSVPTARPRWRSPPGRPTWCASRRPAPGPPRRCGNACGRRCRPQAAIPTR